MAAKLNMQLQLLLSWYYVGIVSDINVTASRQILQVLRYIIGLLNE